MTRGKKLLIGASIVALGAMGTLAVGAVAHDRYKGGYSRDSGHAAMSRHHRFGGHAERMFDRFDTDRDGKVTQAEIDAVRAESIAKYDANGDGVLQIEEYQGLWMARARPRMVDGFQRLDDDGDGKVTDDEMKAPLARMSRFLDRDSDGAITREEMRPRRHHRHDAPRRDRDDDGDRDRN